MLIGVLRRRVMILKKYKKWRAKKPTKSIYMSGKITGTGDTYTLKFLEAENRLKKQGYTVLNPSTLPKGLLNEAYMPMCLSMLNQADEIFMLEGWENSKGATIELLFAEYQNKKVTCEKKEEHFNIAKERIEKQVNHK